MYIICVFNSVYYPYINNFQYVNVSFFLQLNVGFLCNTIYFNHSPFDGYLGFQFFSITNDATLIE